MFRRAFNIGRWATSTSKLVGGYARADFLPSDLAVAEWQNHMCFGRIRLLYIY